MARLSSIKGIFILLVFLSGCNIEQKLARKFVVMEKPKPLLVMKPEFIFKYNLKEFEIPGIDTIQGYLKDSLLFENSIFLKEVSDSMLLNIFTTNFQSTLTRTGFQVLPEDSLHSLMAAGSSATIVNLSQFSLEEYIHPFRSEEVVYNEVLVIDGIDLNALNFNVWIELSIMNGDGAHKVLFASDYLLDNLKGLLKQHLITGRYSFDFTIDTITLENIYEFGGEFGVRTASYLYDYLLNKYIRENLPASYPYEPYYYHYDTRRRIINYAEPEERVIELR